MTSPDIETLRQALKQQEFESVKLTIQNFWTMGYHNLARALYREAVDAGTFPPVLEPRYNWLFESRAEAEIAWVVGHIAQHGWEYLDHPEKWPIPGDLPKKRQLTPPPAQENQDFIDIAALDETNIQP